jgi:hypothetical protein
MSPPRTFQEQQSHGGKKVPSVGLDIVITRNSFAMLRIEHQLFFTMNHITNQGILARVTLDYFQEVKNKFQSTVQMVWTFIRIDLFIYL